MAEYAERDIRALDRQSNYYSRHISAMTAEKLHDKSDIAAELAWRDARIDELATHVERLRDDLQWVWDHVNLGGRAHDRVRGALDSTPKASLARRDLLMQAKALDEVGDVAEKTGLNAHPNVLRMKAKDKRNQAENLK